MVYESPFGDHRVLLKRKALLRNSQVGVEDNWKKADVGMEGSQILDLRAGKTLRLRFRLASPVDRNN